MSDPNITLTKTTEDDLHALYLFQLDKEANYIAAFTPPDSDEKAHYIQKHTKFLSDPTINMRTIRVNDVIVGSVAKFLMHNEAEITYWIDRNQWGKGIATTALTELLKIEKSRPIYGRVAADNYGSQKVLEKCGFKKSGNDRGFAYARQSEIEEYIYVLSDL